MRGKISVKIVHPYERDSWFLWFWWLPDIRYGFRILGIEINYECDMME